MRHPSASKIGRSFPQGHPAQASRPRPGRVRCVLALATVHRPKRTTAQAHSGMGETFRLPPTVTRKTGYVSSFLLSFATTSTSSSQGKGRACTTPNGACCAGAWSSAVLRPATSVHAPARAATRRRCRANSNAQARRSKTPSQWRPCSARRACSMPEELFAACYTFVLFAIVSDFGREPSGSPHRLFLRCASRDLSTMLRPCRVSSRCISSVGWTAISTGDQLAAGVQRILFKFLRSRRCQFYLTSRKLGRSHGPLIPYPLYAASQLRSR
ncbi:MAG: hypothetical protein KatS3mg077_2908 [Candidatus Binatia bacterium]|nr:MAG: hypothetical protein KatS3mg077_2908 [Candidatus Binatia bacterium]